MIWALALWLGLARACEERLDVLAEVTRAHPTHAAMLRALAWTTQDDAALGRPDDPRFLIELARSADGRAPELRVVIDPHSFADYLTFAEAFGRVQRTRFFATEWVAGPGKFGKLRGVFPADPEPGHAGVADGLDLVATLLRPATGPVRLGRQ